MLRFEEIAKPGPDAYYWFQYTGSRITINYTFRGVDKKAVLNRGDRFGVRSGKKGRRLVFETLGTETVFKLTPELQARLEKFRKGS